MLRRTSHIPDFWIIQVKGTCLQFASDTPPPATVSIIWQTQVTDRVWWHHDPTGVKISMLVSLIRTAPVLSSAMFGDVQLYTIFHALSLSWQDFFFEDEPGEWEKFQDDFCMLCFSERFSLWRLSLGNDEKRNVVSVTRTKAGAGTGATRLARDHSEYHLMTHLVYVLVVLANIIWRLSHFTFHLTELSRSQARKSLWCTRLFHDRAATKYSNNHWRFIRGHFSESVAWDSRLSSSMSVCVRVRVVMGFKVQSRC